VVLLYFWHREPSQSTPPAERLVGAARHDLGLRGLSGLIAPRSMEPKTQAEVLRRIKEGDEIIYRILALGQKDGTLRVPDRVIVCHALFGSLNWIKVV
jgi:hypothetical protein